MLTGERISIDNRIRLQFQRQQMTFFQTVIGVFQTGFPSAEKHETEQRKKYSQCFTKKMVLSSACRSHKRGSIYNIVQCSSWQEISKLHVAWKHQ